MIMALSMAAAALGGWLAFGPRAPVQRLQPVVVAGERSRNGLLLPVIIFLSLAAVGIAAGFSGPVVQVATAAVVVATVVSVMRGRSRDRAATARRSAVAEAAQVIAQDLLSGAVPARALADAAQECPVLEPAAVALRIGADPVQVMFAAATRPGAAGMAELARAWALIERTGVPAAPLLQRLAQSVASSEELAAELQAELAAPRFTGRLLAGLPLAGLAVGFIVGGDPLAFLASTQAGQLCLFGGVLLAATGVLWSERLAADTEITAQLPESR